MSGQLEWLYSSRKWCSTHHTLEKPSSSASTVCSMAFSKTCALVLGGERARRGQLVEQAELHGGSFRFLGGTGAPLSVVDDLVDVVLHQVRLASRPSLTHTMLLSQA